MRRNTQRREEKGHFSVKEFEEKTRFKERTINYVKWCRNLKGRTGPTGLGHSTSVETR